jgi:hypothetical protein
MWGHYGFRIMRDFLRPLNEVSCWTTNILWWYRPSFYGGLCPIYFFKEVVLVALYLCSKFHFSIDLFSRSMFLRLKGADTCFKQNYVQCEMTFLL